MLLFMSILTAFLQMLLDECCRLSSNLVYNSSAEEPDLNLPVIINLEADYNINSGQRNFVPMLPQTGIAFVVVKSTKSEQSWRIIKPLLATWPVLVLILIFSLLAGIIAWSLVSSVLWCFSHFLFFISNDEYIPRFLFDCAYN